MSDPEREWLGVAKEELDRLREAKAGYPHTQKMVNTILALVDARTAGQSERSVFERDDTCSRVIYYKKWRDDEYFARCLEKVSEIALGWNDGAALRALEEASRDLALATPLAVKTALQGMSPYHNIDSRLRAAFGILDRAGMKTAAKSSHAFTDSDLNDILDKLTTEELERFGNGDDLISIILDRV